MKKLEISLRGQELPESAIRKLSPFADKAELRGITIHHLNIGQPDIKSPTKAINRLKEYDSDLIPYGTSQGNASLRKKIANAYKKYNVNITPDEIFITTGGSEAIYFIFVACFNPGDEVIVPEPYYTNYKTFAIQTGVKFTTVSSKIENNFALPPISEIEKKINSRTKGIFICNPNNPTGYVYSLEELTQIKELAKKYNLYFISDEVYKEFCFDNVQHHSVLDFPDIENNCIEISSVSKLFSFCGVRIGSIITKNKDILATVLKLGQARLCPPVLGQMVAEAAYDDYGDYISSVNKEYAKRRDFLVTELNKIKGVYAPMPKGAFYTTIKIPVDNAEKFCQWMLEEFSYNNETVMLAPANGFYSTKNGGINQVRIAFVLSIDNMKKAVKCLEIGLNKYNNL